MGRSRSKFNDKSNRFNRSNKSNSSFNKNNKTNGSSNILSNVLGIGGGIALGNAMSFLLFGKPHQNIYIQKADEQNYEQNQEPCYEEFKKFAECLSTNSKNISSCQFAYDMLRKCNENRQF